MTARQQTQLRQGVASHATTSGARIQPHPGPTAPSLSLEQHQEIMPLNQIDRPFIPPKCAGYFSTLKEAHWDHFGLPESERSGIDVILMDISGVETNQVWRTLSNGLMMLDLGRDYGKAVNQGILNGLSEEESRLFASRKLILQIGKEVSASEQVTDRYIRDFDLRISVASRLKSLIDAVGVPEVLLICWDEDHEDYLIDVPIPRFASGTNEEWSSLLSQLLEPSLQLRETCLRLSGVVNMIQRLPGTGFTETRPFLAQEIRRRVKEVLGDSEEDEDDESMADEDVP